MGSEAPPTMLGSALGERNSSGSDGLAPRVGFLQPPARRSVHKRASKLPPLGGGRGSAPEFEKSEPESEPLLLLPRSGFPGSHDSDSDWDATVSAKPVASRIGRDEGYVVGVLKWFGNLERHYGWRLLILLWSSQHLLKGVVNQFQSSAVMFLLQEYNVSGPSMQIYTSIGSAAWALKPLIGVVSDLFPWWGCRKAPYVVATSIIGICSTMLIGSASKESMTVLGTVWCLFGMSLQASTCDLLTEAKYSQKLHEKPAHGPDLITYVWGGVSMGNVLAICVVGTIMTNFGGARAAFLACLVPGSVILVPTLMGYFDEAHISAGALAALRDNILRQGEVLFLCALMTVLTIFLAIVGAVSTSHIHHLAAAIGVLLVLLPSFHLLLRPEIAKVNSFFVLQAALNLSIGGATFYFYTDPPEQFPEGPHFSPWFFASTMGLVSACMSIVGLALYTKYMKNWGYRALILFSNSLVTVLSLLDALMFLRLNVRVGIPDAVFVLGSSVMTTVIKQWQWMPGVVVLSQLCPKGMEATMFALLAGCANLGGQIADYLGAYMLSTLGVHPSGAPGESHMFDNLWKASVVSTLLPAVTILFIPVLIPSAKQTDKLLLENPTSATSGSLLQRLRGSSGWSRSSSIPP